MPKLLALEWDNHEARLLVASARGGQITLEGAFTVPDLAGGNTGEKIAAAMAAHRISGVETYVAVGRSNIELKRLTLPPAPDEDLPDLVRFQAEREFTSLTDESPLDFLPLSSSTDQQRIVLAAAVSADLVAQIDGTCEAARLKPRRLILRPCAAASLLRRRASADEGSGARLLIDLLADEADLTVMVGDNVVLLRTARLAGAIADETPDRGPLLAEIRRTIATAQNQLGGRVIEEIRLCAGPDEYEALIGQIATALGIPTRRFDPFEGVDQTKSLAANPPLHAGRFAPLVGMLVDETAGTPPGIDFLNPRRRPAPVSQRRTYVLAGSAAAVVALMVGGWLWYQAVLINGDIASLSGQIEQHQKTLGQQAEIASAVSEINDWAAGDIVWLDELRELSTDFPNAEQAMLTELRITPHADGGQIQLDGLVHDTGVVDVLETGLRDDSHRVQGQGAQQETEPDHYRWSFSSAVVTKAQADSVAAAKEQK